MLAWLWRALGWRTDQPADDPAKAAALAMLKAAGGAASSPSALESMGNSTERGLNASGRQALAYNKGWVFSAIRPIAQRLAGQAVHVGKKGKRRPSSGPRSGKAAMPQGGPPWMRAVDVTEVEAHPLLDALADPNPHLVAYALFYLTVFSLQLCGVAYWWVDDSEDGLRIWFLPAHWCRPETTEGREGISHYVVRADRSFDEIHVPAEIMLRFSLPDPADPLHGAFSPLMAAFRSVETDNALEEAQRATFRNGINPGFAIKVGRLPETVGVQGELQPVLTKEQRNTLINAVKAAYAGYSKAGEPLILDGLINDVFKIHATAQEMDYLNSGQATKDRIWQTFGTNPIVCGAMQDANRASATVADEIFCTNVLNPLAVLIGQTATRFFAAYHEEPDLVVWLEPARTRDPEQRRLDLDQVAKYGALTRNELRLEHGLDPLPEGMGGNELVSAPKQAEGQSGGPTGDAAKGKGFRS